MSSNSVKLSANRTPATQRRLWGRRMTRPLGKDRQQAFDKIFPLISIPENFVERKRNIDPRSLFPSSAPVWLEIGFGNGEHLAALMEKNPDINFIGAEPFINGVGAFTQIIQNKPTERICVFMDDAMRLVETLKKESLDRIYILNPDPWPKKRHNKRRLVRKENLDQFARVLKPGGLLLMCTDVNDLAEWMLIYTVNHPSFEWQATSCEDWKNAPPGWASTTRYAEKGRKAGRSMTYLIFKKACQSPL
ncbi:MAG: tRNA (guanosine(46)-N7)-methyltransferase TrmB [Alphaproteobacteria bacterium]|nr:tRNA (guanosine(46)-N7)-methyltransferase TrmB [Alphaproteobacteria bacterium]